MKPLHIVIKESLQGPKYELVDKSIHWAVRGDDPVALLDGYLVLREKRAKACQRGEHVFKLIDGPVACEYCPVVRP